MEKVMNKIELEQAISGKITRSIAENKEGGALLRKRLRAVKICLKISVNEHSLKFLAKYFKEYSVDNKDYGVPYEVYKYLENRLEANQEQE